MSKFAIGSFELTKAIAAAQKGHSAFKRGKIDPTRIFGNIIVWINDEPDEKGNHISIQLSPTKENRLAGEKKVYIGNAKFFEPKGAEEQVDIPNGEEVVSANVLDKLPF